MQTKTNKNQNKTNKQTNKQFIPYSGKLSREKTMNWWKILFSQRKFSQIARFCHTKECHVPNFAEKTFANSYKTAKFAKVFSLKGFLLYGSTTNEEPNPLQPYDDCW